MNNFSKLYTFTKKPRILRWSQNANTQLMKLKKPFEQYQLPPFLRNVKFTTFQKLGIFGGIAGYTIFDGLKMIS